MAEKPHMNLVFVGHVDHGKSTLIGRLFLETGVISDKDIEKLKKVAKESGKETFELAFVMDKLKEERDRGLTIDLAHTRFDTDKYYYTIIDAPGHRDFVKNMITGASQADAAVLVVDAKDGIMPQTKEHLFLAKTGGIDQVVVSLNKMDLVEYKQERYNELKEKLSKLLKSIGYKPGEVHFIPMSSYYLKENITESNGKMPWYDGPTLLEALDEFKVPEKPVDKPLRIPVQDIYSITGIGTVPVGRVETGVLKVGDEVVFEPSDVSGEVKSIEMHHEGMDRAEPGDNVGFNVRGISRKDLRRGDVCGHTDNPPTVVDEFTAQVVILQHPTAIAPGYTPVFHAHTAQVACSFVELQKKVDPKTGETIEENPDFLKTGDVAVVKIKPTRAMVLEKASDIAHLGRFAVRDMGQTIAAGMVLDLKKAK